MKQIISLLLLHLLFISPHVFGGDPIALYVHGLNANVGAKAYEPFFKTLMNKNKLIISRLPGHQYIGELTDLSPQKIKTYMDSMKSISPTPEETTVYAHSMGAILWRNYISEQDRSRFKKIIYLAPGAPPKYYWFFKYLIKLLPSDMEISSYSPKSLRLNDSIPISAYELLFQEVEKFKQQKKLLANEEIWVHEKDEVVDVQELKSTFPATQVKTGTSQHPYHVYFLL